jgi:hypothetical protein
MSLQTGDAASTATSLAWRYETKSLRICLGHLDDGRRRTHRRLRLRQCNSQDRVDHDTGPQLDSGRHCIAHDCANKHCPNDNHHLPSGFYVSGADDR